MSNPTNEQELREQINAIREELVGRNQTHQQVARLSKWTRIELENVIKQDGWIYEDEMIALVQAHTNAEIAKLLDRLEANIPALEDYACADCEWTGGKHSLGCCGSDMNYWRLVSAIQAERAKLKERYDE